MDGGLNLKRGLGLVCFWVEAMPRMSNMRRENVRSQSLMSRHGRNIILKCPTRNGTFPARALREGLALSVYSVHVITMASI